MRESGMGERRGLLGYARPPPAGQLAATGSIFRGVRASVRAI